MKISYVIPAYNAEETLAESVRSIFAGNLEEGDEVIVVNDASTDGTLKVAEGLAKEHPSRVMVISNTENKGCPASRNVGISRAKNELVFNLDADNVLIPGMVAKLKAALEAERADAAAFAEQDYFRKSTDRVSHKWMCKTGVFTMADFLSGIVNQGPGGNYLYRKAVWERIGHYWEYGRGLHEAWGFTLKLLMNGAKFVVVPDTRYYHRYSHESLFVRESKNSTERIRIGNLFLEHLYPLLDEESQAYTKANPDWLDKLARQPLRLRGQIPGTDGRIVYVGTIGMVKRFVKRLYDTR